MTAPANARKILLPTTEDIPVELRQRRQWVAWRYLEDDKMPVDPTTGDLAKVNDPATWGDFQQACQYARRHGLGVGFVFTGQDPFCGVDFDDIRDPETGTINIGDFQRIQGLDSYSEISPSGKGVKVILKAKVDRAHKKQGLEVYPHGRFFTITGHHLPGTPETVEERQRELDALIGEVFASTGHHSGAAEGMVLEGARNNTLTSLAGALRHQGLGQEGLEAALLGINAAQCSPPLSEEEVLGIAQSVGRYPPALPRPVVVQLATVAPERVEFLWPPYIPLGKLTILEGDPGVGKSWLALAIAAAVSRGLKLLGAAEAREPADVLLLSAEDGVADTIVPRLEAMGADRRRIHALTGIATDKGEKGFSLAEHLDLLEEVMAQYRPIFVVLDPLVFFLGAGVDMHRANETRALLSPLGSLAERYRAAILAIRHLTKTGRDKALYRGLGSIDLTAAARSVLLAGKDPESGKRAIVHTKSNLAPEGRALGYCIEDGQFFWTGASDLTAARLLAPEGQDERSALGEAEDFLHEALSDGERPVTEVQKEARAAGIQERTLDRAKAQLGIQARRRNKLGGKRGEGEWVWALPNLQDVQGCQDSTVEDLASLNSSERKPPGSGQDLDTLNPPRWWEEEAGCPWEEDEVAVD